MTSLLLLLLCIYIFLTTLLENITIRKNLNKAIRYMTFLINDLNSKHIFFMSYNKNKLLSYIFNSNKKHTYHMVTPSPWPVMLSLCLLILVLSFISAINFMIAPIFLLYSFFLLLACTFFWFRDINRESTYMGYHTLKVQTLLRTGFILFLVSEVMVFFGFFWAYFHAALSPSIIIGNIWPPEGIVLHILSEDIISSPAIFYGWTDLNNDWDSLYDIIEINSLTNKNLLLQMIDNMQFFNYKTAYGEIANSISENEIDLINFFKISVSSDLDSYAFLQLYRFLLFSKEYNLSEEDLLLSIWHLIRFESYVSILDDWILDLCIPLKFDILRLELILEEYSQDQNLFYFYVNAYDSGSLVNPYGIPLFNTLILLTSGCTLMWSHSCLRLRSYLRSLIGLIITILFALSFIFCQFYEYAISAFSILDGVYGTTFYMLTGLHGFHVIVGTIFLTVCCIRMYFMEFSSNNHFSYEAAIWYWHFVDVVWIILYIFVYIWPAFFYFKESSAVLSTSNTNNFTSYFFSLFYSSHELTNNLNTLLNTVNLAEPINNLTIKYLIIFYILNYFFKDSAHITNYYNNDENILMQYLDNETTTLWNTDIF